MSGVVGIKVFGIALPGDCAAGGATGKLIALPEDLLDLGGFTVADEDPLFASEA